MNEPTSLTRRQLQAAEHLRKALVRMHDNGLGLLVMDGSPYVIRLDDYGRGEDTWIKDAEQLSPLPMRLLADGGGW